MTLLSLYIVEQNRVDLQLQGKQAEARATTGAPIPYLPSYYPCLCCVLFLDTYHDFIPVVSYYAALRRIMLTAILFSCHDS